MNLKGFISFLILILVLFYSCQNNKNKVEYVVNNEQLGLEYETNEDYLTKNYIINHSQNEIIFSSDQYDLDGDGENDKIKVVVTDKDFYEKKENGEYGIGVKGEYYAQIFVNDISKETIFFWSHNSDYETEFKIVDINKTDTLKELLITYYEPADEDPSKIHSIFRYFGNKLLTETKFNSEGYSGGKLEIIDNKIIINHKTNPETIGTYTLSNYFFKNTDMFIGEETLFQAACPYVYLKVGHDFIYKGEIIRNLIGKNSENLQKLELGHSKDEKIIVRITEEKKETSYLNFIALECNGEIITPIKNSKNLNVLIDDDKYLILKKGEYVDFEFKIPKNSKNYLVGKGYYIPIQ